MKFKLKPPTYLDLAEHVPGTPFKYKHGWVKVVIDEEIGSSITKMKHDTKSHTYKKTAFTDGEGPNHLFIYPKDGGPSEHHVFANEKDLEAHVKKHIVQHVGGATTETIAAKKAKKFDAAFAEIQAKSDAAIAAKKAKTDNDVNALLLSNGWENSHGIYQKTIGSSEYEIESQGFGKWSTAVTEENVGPFHTLSMNYNSVAEAVQAATDHEKIVASGQRDKQHLLTSAENVGSQSLPQSGGLAHLQLGLPAHNNTDVYSPYQTDENTMFDEHGKELGGSVDSERVRADTKIGINNRMTELVLADENPGLQAIFTEMKAEGKSQDDIKEKVQTQMRQMVDTWASSATGNALSNAMQIDAYRMFGVGAGEYLEGKSEKYGEPAVGPEMRQAFLRATYKQTQAELIARGVPEQIELYRGMQFTQSNAPEWAEQARVALFSTSTNTEVNVTHLNPLTSWATNELAARAFTGGSHGVMIHATIPRSALISSALTGLGCLNEYEFVAAGLDGVSSVRNTY